MEALGVGGMEQPGAEEGVEGDLEAQLAGQLAEQREGRDGVREALGGDPGNEELTEVG
jgi:hypothetical protein